MTRTDSKRDLIAEMGATPAIADALVPEQVARVVAEAEPEAIINQMTDLDIDFNPKKVKESLAPTNRLRTEGNDHLLAAGRAIGTRLYVAQSFVPSIYAREGSGIKTEQDPVDSNPPDGFRDALGAILHLEDSVRKSDGMEGIILRYGAFYGPGTTMAANPDGGQLAPIRARKFPVVGNGAGVWSFVHVADAAEATVLAMERGEAATYNITDDNPAPVCEWLPKVAEAIGARPPRRFPGWLAKLMIGETGFLMMTALRGASNEKAKRELGWQPEHVSIWSSLAEESR